jgi:hypothetical protein
MDRAPLQQLAADCARPEYSACPAENDENSGAGASFSVLTQAFNQRIAELQQAVCMRIEGEPRQAACRRLARGPAR